MKLVTRSFTVLAAFVVATWIVSSPGRATPPPTAPTVTFGIDPGTSTPLGVSATQPDPNAGIYVYTYTVTSGDALSDTIPLSICLDALSNPDSISWSDQVEVSNIAGDFAGDVTSSGSPWPFDSITSTVGSCQTGSLVIAIPAGVLTTVGNSVYTTNVLFDTTNGSPGSGPTKLKDGFDTPKHIQIRINVTAADTSRITCFMTDSDGNVLLKCDGSPANASGETDGTFAIVANPRNKSVATNPGQFYYNLLWRNDTGSDQTVKVNMSLTGLVAQGAQAVHWLTFPTSGGSVPGFDQVIDGNPAGSTGSIKNVLVPAGDTLYVTYHLEWKGLGSTAPTTNSCGDSSNVKVKVAGTVTFGSPATTDNCTAGASGYLKQ
jgi:archaellum component FlaG (FlaF/FlaG flagellin family)